VLLDARQTHVGRLSLGSHPRAGLRLSERVALRVQGRGRGAAILLPTGL
jgi:hypothetical protein